MKVFYRLVLTPLNMIIISNCLSPSETEHMIIIPNCLSPSETERLTFINTMLPELLIYY